MTKLQPTLQEMLNDACQMVSMRSEIRPLFEKMVHAYGGQFTMDSSWDFHKTKNNNVVFVNVKIDGKYSELVYDLQN